MTLVFKCYLSLRLPLLNLVTFVYSPMQTPPSSWYPVWQTHSPEAWSQPAIPWLAADGQTTCSRHGDRSVAATSSIRSEQQRSEVRDQRSEVIHACMHGVIGSTNLMNCSSNFTRLFILYSLKVWWNSSKTVFCNPSTTSVTWHDDRWSTTNLGTSWHTYWRLSAALEGLDLDLMNIMMMGC